MRRVCSSTVDPSAMRYLFSEVLGMQGYTVLYRRADSYGKKNPVLE